MLMPTITLKPGREKSLLRRHPWIFSGAVARVDGDPTLGATVDVLGAGGQFLAHAAYSPISQIRARVWTFDPSEPVDADFFRRRIQSCLDSRNSFHFEDQVDAFRLVHAESDGLPGLINFFHQHPEELSILDSNPRYVFFTERPGGPFGCLNEPVTPYYSIAVDKTIFPRACVAYMQNVLPARNAAGKIEKYNYAGFAMDQDRGNAIRAAGRCDVFLGTGKEVGQLAGGVMDEGELYYIFVK